MSRKSKNKITEELNNVVVEDFAAEGKAIAYHNGKVVFIPYGAPGDMVDVKIIRSKSNYAEAEIIRITKASEKRTQPFCVHFRLCGGCKWQHVHYSSQLHFKQVQVTEQLKRIGGLNLPEVSEIIGSTQTTEYRNKLEFTFSNKRWLDENDMHIEPSQRQMNGLGFHLPGRFDRVLDINQCHLQRDISNQIRNRVKDFCLVNNLEFYDVKQHQGFLRNLIVRTNQKGDCMVIVVFGKNEETKISMVLDFILSEFPELYSLYYIVNSKRNDDLSDQKPLLFWGNPFLYETIGSRIYQIGPLSFFQTNPAQAYQLFSVVKDFAGLQGHEIVYDLYTGAGSIAIFIADSAKKIVGIDYVESAIVDARINTSLNGFSHLNFYAGDIAKTLTDEFVHENGIPDVVICDPPRSGMHPNVIEQLMKVRVKKIVYVSCNPATQARDLSIMKELYRIEKVQPVDMFPHTQHVENVCLLNLQD